MITEENYKAKKPEDTIKKIRDILYENDFFIIENHWKRNEMFFSSVQLSYFDLPFFTNGKGRNEKYTLASAYAEFLERLQNLILVEGKCFSGNQENIKITYPDKVMMKYDEYRVDNEHVIKGLLDRINREKEIEKLKEIYFDKEMLFYNFYDVRNDRTQLLPFDFLRLSVGSNGMCAGNTPEEALIQGICEIFERYVFKYMHSDSFEGFPVIPDDIFKDSSLWKNFEFLRDNGFEVSAKDCSLGGRFPVTGLLIKKGPKAIFNLGSSPDFYISIERCLTEMFQGFDLNSIESQMEDILSSEKAQIKRTFSSEEKKGDYLYKKALQIGKGILNPLIFDDSLDFDEKNLFKNKSVISSEALKQTIDILKKSNYDIYVRDVSFLGFPTYHIYIPGLSEVSNFSLESLKITLDTIKLRPLLFKLDKLDNGEVLQLIEHIEGVMDDPAIVDQNIIQKIFNLFFFKDSSINLLEIENLLVLLYIKIEDFANAHRVLQGYLKNRLDVEQFYNPPDFAKDHFCLLDFLEIRKSNSISTNKAIETLKEKYDASVVEEISKVIQNSQSISEYFDIPKCISCTECEHALHCSYLRIKGFYEKLQSIVNKADFSQIHLKEVFN